MFLHLDNNAYLEGETLWFKAYVVRASSLKPRPLSRVLYVELLSDAGALMQRKLLRLDSLGQANGEFDLELPVRSGYYEVRAYTREMTNWGAAACFSRVVPVFRKGKDGKLDNVPLTEMPRKTSRAFPRPNGVLDSVKTIVEFYPEGGNRAEGVAQRVAFRLTNGRGFPSPGILHIKTRRGRKSLRRGPNMRALARFSCQRAQATGFMPSWTTTGNATNCPMQCLDCLMR